MGQHKVPSSTIVDMIAELAHGSETFHEPKIAAENRLDFDGVKIIHCILCVDQCLFESQSGIRPLVEYRGVRLMAESSEGLKV